MKRKIAAILAADIAGYSKLIAEDEEETLRRLGSYRAVFDDFVARAGGRIFNTAGDSVLAEFSSTVEAVRCAIDIQESLRTRNLAYPASRQMNYRIGITVGDVVERDGDLLGDGVNIAARLESLAPAGGICISQAVHEQVANKLSVPFSDIGEQQVKNIPTPVHAFIVGMAGGATQQGPLRSKLHMLAAAGIAVALLGVGVWSLRSPTVAPTAPAIATTPAPIVAVPAALPAPKARPQLVPEQVPFVRDAHRAAIRSEYMPAADHKALAISAISYGIATGRDNAEQARTIALENCKRTSREFACDVFAVGTEVVSGRARPPMPPQPWLRRDPSIEQPFAASAVPFIPPESMRRIEQVYMPGKSPKAVAISALGASGFYHQQPSQEEAVRRALEFCGDRGQIACRIIAIDDVFVLAVPTTMKVAGFFLPSNSSLIAPERREEVAQKLSSKATGWSAVAAGSNGNAGVAAGESSEAAAIEAALAECARRDSRCRVISIGPFSVEPK